MIRIVPRYPNRTGSRLIGIEWVQAPMDPALVLRAGAAAPV
jgi:hypothetical protein